LEVDEEVIPLLNVFLKDVKQRKPDKMKGNNFVLLLILFLGMILVGAAAVFAFLVVKPCPDGYDHFLPMKGDCYYVSNATTVDRGEAQQQCEKKKGTLVELHTKEELQNVEANLRHMNLTTSEFWIGLIRRPLSPFIDQLSEEDQKRSSKDLTGGFKGQGEYLPYSNLNVHVKLSNDKYVQ
jgi:hypothetical protein